MNLDFAGQSVCANFSLRDQHGTDWLLCEGAKGWPAQHVVASFVAYLFFHEVATSWTLSVAAAWAYTLGFELFEVLSVVLFGQYVGFGPVHETQKETLAGVLIGDMLSTNLLGIVICAMLLYVQGVWGLLPRFDLENREFLRQLLLSTAFSIGSFSTMFVLPDGCTETVPRSCTNLGLMFTTAIYTVLFAAMMLTDSKGARVPRKKRRLYYALNVLFVLTVSVQNFQPLMPLYLGPGGEWFQVWLVCGLWFLALLPFVLWKWWSTRRRR